MPHGEYKLHQRTFIGLLNLAVIGLMLGTYTSRFIFPMISLEGRNFWILGLLPIARDRVLYSKLAYAALVSVSTSFILALLSEVMLSLPWPVVLLHLLTILILALGLSAISVGLGAFLVNLKESNPSKIATGFGGTINLLVSLLYAIVVVALAGLPTFVYFASSSSALQQSEYLDLRSLRVWMIASLAGQIVLGALAVYVPMRLGRRAFARMEF
jgi:ABC-2 type transport system permease protein